MAKSFNAVKKVSGTFGTVWYDGEELAEIISFKAEVNGKYESVVRTHHMMDGQKLVGLEGKGEFKCSYVYDTVKMKMHEAFKAGKTPLVTIQSDLSDPDANGSSRVVCYNCALDKLILADWEAGKSGEESYSFTFDDWDILDYIKRD